MGFIQEPKRIVAIPANEAIKTGYVSSDKGGIAWDEWVNVAIVMFQDTGAGIHERRWYSKGQELAQDGSQNKVAEMLDMEQDSGRFRSPKKPRIFA